MQRNWIGRSEGAEIRFPLDDGGGDITVFTTRPDTLFGATFMSMAAEHPMVMEFAKRKPAGSARCGSSSTGSRAGPDRPDERVLEKEGIFTGGYCVNPVTGNRMPVYAANFVLYDYGTGA